jgi:chromatin accessibility complex protein 1
MKMDQNISGVNIGVEASYLVCAATEHFIQWMAKEVYEEDTKALSYQSLSKHIQADERLDFLRQIVPNKITVREYRKILAEEDEKVFDSGSDVSSSSSEEEESGEDEDESSAEGSEEEDNEEKK